MCDFKESTLILVVKTDQWLLGDMGRSGGRREWLQKGTGIFQVYLVGVIVSQEYANVESQRSGTF